MSSEDILKLFTKYGHEQNKIDYKMFCQEIANTKLDADNTYAGMCIGLM